MTTPPAMPPVPPRVPPNLAAGTLGYGAQALQATTRGFGQLAGLLGQIAHLLGKGPATSTAPGASGFGGASTFGSSPGTAAQWAARAQQRQRMTQTAAGRLAGMGNEAQALGQLHDSHQDALRRMRQQQQAFANQWRGTHLTEGARTSMTPEQQAQSQRRLAQADLQFSRRSQSYVFDVGERVRQYHESRDKLTQQRRDLEAQVRQGHTDQYQAGQAMQAARRLEGRRAAASFGMEVGGKALSAVGGMVSSYYAKDDYEAISQFGRRMSLMSPMRGGTAGQHAQTFGQQLRVGGLNNWATSSADWVGGAQSIIMQTAPRMREQALRQAGSDAFVSGMGIQAAANAQADLGTSQSFYATQMFGLTPTRTAKGGRASLTDMAMSVANRVNHGNFSGLSADDLQAQLSQGGSLSTSLQTVGQAAGWSGQTLDMMRSQLEAMRGLMNPGGGAPGMSQKKAQSTITSAAGGDKGAIDALKQSGMDLGSTYSDAQNILAGKDREGHLSTSASYLDAAKASADTLVDIKNLLQKVLGPLAGVMGSLQGGGILGAAGSHAGALTLGGGAILGPAGAVGGAMLGYGSKLLATMGGGDASVTPNRQNSGNSGGGSGLASGNAGAVIGAAEAQLGKPYLWGGTGPDGWDCSGLMQAAYKRGAGIDLPRVSEAQARVGVEVPMDQLLPGDLLFPSKDSPPHVAMYIGGGQIIEAPRTGLNVRETPMGDRFHYARRVLGGAGSAAASATPDQSGKGAVASGAKSASFAPLVASAGYGSVEEVDALAAVLGGGGFAGGQQGGTPPVASASQNSGASNSSSSAGSTPAGSSGSSGVRGIARGLMAQYGFGADQWDALDWIWTKESGWNSAADNPTSTAYGIPQALEFDPKTGTGHKMTGEYADYHSNATTQIKWGLNYIKSRYGSPVKAKAFWEAHNWYSGGAYDVPGDQVAKLHQGEMVLTKSQATTMRQALMEGPPGPAAGAGVGGSVCLEFLPGSIVISMPSATSDGAQSAARSFVDFVAADDRIKSLMGGW